MGRTLLALDALPPCHAAAWRGIPRMRWILDRLGQDANSTDRPARAGIAIQENTDDAWLMLLAI